MWVAFILEQPKEIEYDIILGPQVGTNINSLSEIYSSTSTSIEKIREKLKQDPFVDIEDSDFSKIKLSQLIASRNLIHIEIKLFNKP